MSESWFSSPLLVLSVSWGCCDMSKVIGVGNAKADTTRGYVYGRHPIQIGKGVIST